MSDAEWTHYQMLKDFMRSFSTLHNDWILEGWWMDANPQMVARMDGLITLNNKISAWEVENVD